MSRPDRKVVAIRDQIQAVRNMDRKQCLALWRESFASPPAKYLSQPFMQKAIVYELQCRALKGVPKSTRRALIAITKGKKAASTPARTLTRGMCLLREWNGRTFEVEVTEVGFIWRDKSYRSLSAIAREITGTRWSGPRFFGVAHHERQEENSLRDLHSQILGRGTGSGLQLARRTAGSLRSVYS